MVRHGHGLSLEGVGTMLEMADMAWHALEHRHERKSAALDEDEAEAALLRAANLRLRRILAENLALLQTIYDSQAVSHDCPPDLHLRLVAAVENSKFLEKLEPLHQELKSVPNYEFPSTESTDAFPSGTEVPITFDDGEPSWWVWVAHELTPDCLEEVSGIDNENYAIISEDNVVDGISNFIARCIIEHPKSKILTPEELRKAMTDTLDGVKDRRKWKEIWEAGKVIYTLSTWGIALAGLYRHRVIVKAAAKGVCASAKFVRKVL